jgi:hypothetical protein
VCYVCYFCVPWFFSSPFLGFHLPPFIGPIIASQLGRLKILLRNLNLEFMDASILGTPYPTYMRPTDAFVRVSKTIIGQEGMRQHPHRRGSPWSAACLLLMFLQHLPCCHQLQCLRFVLVASSWIVLMCGRVSR